MKDFFEKAAMQNHPLRVLQTFLEFEGASKKAKKYDDMRFVGYVLDIGYDTVTIITSDPFKIAVGGVPRNSLLIMVPVNSDTLPPHFTLLRVLEAAPTPLSKEVQQTYFELQKKSMPELDVFTQSELQWGALKTGVLGMFYPNPEKIDHIEFSGDLNNFVSAHKYSVYSPDDNLLNLVINALVPEQNRFQIGDLRLTECRLPLPNKPQPRVPVNVSTNDFKGTRTAMFGKTRLGKSNVVKLIVQSLIETTAKTRNVGQLIFDINGEYANDNPQDNNFSIRSAYPDRCIVFALTPKENTPSEPLKVNFFHNPSASKEVLNTLIRQSGRGFSDYINAFLSVGVPEFDIVTSIPNNRINEKIRAIRRIQFYFALLHKAGFTCDETTVRNSIPSANKVRGFNPVFSDGLRNATYQFAQVNPTPNPPNTLDQLQRELETIVRFKRNNPNDPNLTSGSGNPIIDQDDNAILEILEPQPGRSGIIILLPLRSYHDHRAGNYTTRILELLDQGQTAILDLGNADEVLMNYFSRQLSEAVFYHQTDKFTSNRLGSHFVQLYFEEAHNLFGYNDTSDETRIYRRFAKEGAKYHIGMVYSTQSPTTINSDLLAQTENFFIAHLASQDDVNKLAKLNIAYESLKDDILQAKTPGYIRMLTRSHRFVVSMQARMFVPTVPQANSPMGG
jgi:hypothetical protein